MGSVHVLLTYIYKVTLVIRNLTIAIATDSSKKKAMARTTMALLDNPMPYTKFARDLLPLISKLVKVMLQSIKSVKVMILQPKLTQIKRMELKNLVKAMSQLLRPVIFIVSPIWLHICRFI